ncbi:MAG: nucleotidyl transferase AbiEii/AbiGii toxin family protein [Bacilli bacterium]|nr:nucleotidyl transferase AbiEii/AbiGii toxin family protein [Bacilli bacterium]
MSETIKELIEDYISKGFTLFQARNLTAQFIILSKIGKSKYADSVLLKGGVVMYNMTHEQRRTTSDLDFDFIRYNISNDNIKLFIDALNNKNSQYKITINGKIETLHQQDYHGKRVKLLVKDKTETIKFKLDIGVHTLLAINQNKMCFSFDQENNLTLLVNPPEQMFSEKLFSLAKIGPTSVRFKDVDDMFYLIKNKSIDIKIVRKCLELLVINPVNDIKGIQDVIDKASDTLQNELFAVGYINSDSAWLKQDYNKTKSVLIDYIYRI